MTKGKDGRFVKGGIPWNKGIPRTKKVREKLSRSRMKWLENKNNKEKFMKQFERRSQNYKWRENVRSSVRQRWRNPEMRKKYLRGFSKRDYVALVKKQSETKKRLYKEGKLKAWNKGYGDYIRGEKNPRFRKDITKKSVYKTVENIINEYGKDICKKEFINLLQIKLKCCHAPIYRVCGSINNILDEFGLQLKNNKSWKNKEELGIELCKELYGSGKIKKYYKTNLGRTFPDYVPNDITKPIIDIKSTLNDITIRQESRYESIRNNNRFMVFENKGSTIIPQTKIIYIKEIIKTLPNNRKLLFQQKYEKIRKNIPLEQKTITAEDKGKGMLEVY